MIYDGQFFKNISATPAKFQLVGGYYSLDAVATWGGGNATLQRLAGDGTTWLEAMPPITANGSEVSLLPPGWYQLAITTATAVYCQLCRIPV